jgi:hypothetical protein
MYFSGSINDNRSDSPTKESCAAQRSAGFQLPVTHPFFPFDIAVQNPANVALVILPVIQYYYPARAIKLQSAPRNASLHRVVAVRASVNRNRHSRVWRNVLRAFGFTRGMPATGKPVAGGGLEICCWHRDPVARDGCVQG